MSRRPVGILVVAALAAGGCSSLFPSPAATAKAPYTLAPPTPTIGPISTVADSKPGRPYDATQIQAEFAEVPLSFPPELRTAPVAAALAQELWTFDGRQYRDLLLDGSCDDGGRRCDLTVTGLPGYAPTRDASDAWFWSVDPATGTLTATGSDLNGFPQEVVPDLDALARVLDTTGQLRPLELLGARWIAPEGYFALRYGHGLEEGDPTTMVILDRDARRIVSMSPGP